jgi:hypothetical protein
LNFLNFHLSIGVGGLELTNKFFHLHDLFESLLEGSFQSDHFLHFLHFFLLEAFNIFQSSETDLMEVHFPFHFKGLLDGFGIDFA